MIGLKKKGTLQCVSATNMGTGLQAMAQCFNRCVFSRYRMYIPGFPLVFVATLPSLPRLNEVGRVAASAPAVGGHRVNPTWLPLSLRLPPLSLCHASGLLTAAGTV